MLLMGGSSKLILTLHIQRATIDLEACYEAVLRARSLSLTAPSARIAPSSSSRAGT